MTEREDAAARAYRARHYILLLCILVGVMSYVDRQILSILMEPIKTELKLTDKQLGLLAGPFFSVFFLVAGIPLARLSDTRNRRTMIAACLSVWSAATMACGVAVGFVQLAIARAATATGEAGSGPASYSLLADLYPPRSRARVYGLFSLGASIGLSFGVFFGGRLNDMFGWRQTFIMAGLPGLFVALLFFLAVREPPRPPRPQGEAQLGFGRAVAGLLRLRTFRAVLIASAGQSATGFAIMAWLPSLLMRQHDASAGSVGALIGTVMAVSLVASNLVSGHLGSTLARRAPHWLLWVPGFGTAIAVPFAIAGLLAQSALAAAICFGFALHFITYVSPPALAALVGVADPRSRAVATSTIPIAQAIGSGIGPFAVGWISDIALADHGSRSVAIGLAWALTGSVIASIACFSAGRAVDREFRDEGADIAIRHG